MAQGITLTPELIAALSGTKVKGTPWEGKTYVEVSAKPGATSRIEHLPFAWKVEGGWLTEEVVRRISKGTEQPDGTVKGGGNATYSAKTPPGFDLPLGLNTEFKVGGFLIPKGQIVTGDDGFKRCVSQGELVFGLDGTVTEVVYDGDGNRVSPETADDIYNVRINVTQGKKPYYVAMTAQHKGSVGFYGLSGEAKFVAD